MQSYINVNLESSGRIERSSKKRKTTSKGGTFASSHHHQHQQQQQRHDGDHHHCCQTDRDEADDLMKQPRERFKYWLRKLITLLFSQVGVGSLLVCYTILGAMLFISIESGVDSRRLSQVSSLRSSTVLQLWNVTQNYNVLYDYEWKEDVDQIVQHFQSRLVQEIKLGYKGGDAKPPWTFPQALMFSLSVYTTIGYGNLTPKTDWGKATTCIYAMFGIPLLLLYMANVGDLLATSFQQFYRTLNRCKTRVNEIREISREREKEKKRLLLERMNPEGGENEQEQRKEALIVGVVKSKASSPFTTASSSTTSFSGDYTKIGHQTEGGGKKGEEKDIKQIESVAAAAAAAVKKPNHQQQRPSVKVVVNEPSPQDSNEQEEGNEVTTTTTIPISTCLSVFFCYILLGSILFSWWEGWEYFEGSYFCFVSLVTIGFSDMVPGKSRSIGLALSPGSFAITNTSPSATTAVAATTTSAATDGDSTKSTEERISRDAIRSITNGGGGGGDIGNVVAAVVVDDGVVMGSDAASAVVGGNGIVGSASGSNGQEEISLDHQVDGQLILCSIYILFGMALMAMCFHLTQERFFATAKKLGRALHLL